ncbi:glycoside hydrolase superfamily [Rhizoctonia solani]|nr:glycoside hydrolase superfamily [Rhizoctonia solani]
MIVGTAPTKEWAAAITKAKAAVSKLTLAEKVSLGTGGIIQSTMAERTLCRQHARYLKYQLSRSLPSRFPTWSPIYRQSLGFPAGINIAATFNRDLMRKRGVALGAEFRGKGIHVALGPAVGITRVPAGGRNWEGFGADPYLAGEAAYETVIGIQSQGVQACAKHYINNEQEHFRQTSSSNVDDRTVRFWLQHEIYLPPFLKAVQAGVASIMGAYNQGASNGTYACENSHILNDILKSELGFQGYVMSDWWATHSGATSVNAGLDMTMPGDKTIGSGTTYFGSNLVNAVKNGEVSQSRIDDLATRILAAWYLLGQDSGYPDVNFDSWDIKDPFNKHIDVQGDHKTLIRSIGAASTVLLKNKNSALPLKAPSTIAVIGSDAGSDPKGINSCADRGCNRGILAQGWGSGTAEYPYLVDPLHAIKNKASSIGATVTSSLSDSDIDAVSHAARGKDVALVFISADSGEGYITVEGNAGDRKNLHAWHDGDALVEAVAAVNKNTVVIVHTVGQIIMESWINHPNGNGTDSEIVQIPYKEGLKVDYRAFDANDIAPRFEFGFGLSYTTFEYSNLTVTLGGPGGTQPTGPGSPLSSWLQTPWAKLTFTVKNTGTVAGTEIPQLYISPPASSGEPPNALKGFDSVYLQPGASTIVSMALSRPDRRQAKNVLKKAFEKNFYPNKQQIEAISVDCGRSVETVVKWFNQERQKHGIEERRSAPSSSQPVIHGIRDRDSSVDLVRTASINRLLMANGGASGKWPLPSAANEQWGQYPPSNADDVPSMAFGELHKQQHELHCAMAMYHQATLGLPMNLTLEPEAK